MKILLVEDESAAAGFVCRGLRQEGYAVDIAANSSEAEAAIGVHEYDLAILDVTTPSIDGFELCRRLRSSGHTLPILFLSARDDCTDRVKGLDLGGDDYLVKPFCIEELLARVRALLRRVRGVMAGAKIVVSDVEIDLAGHVVRRSGRMIELTVSRVPVAGLLCVEPGQGSDANPTVGTRLGERR